MWLQAEQAGWTSSQQTDLQRVLEVRQAAPRAHLKLLCCQHNLQSLLFSSQSHITTEHEPARSKEEQQEEPNAGGGADQQLLTNH
jgi:hypothetical protein